MSKSVTPTLFLCWSGHRSKQVAEAFKHYFQEVFDQAKTDSMPHVAMSETLIAKGAPWSPQLLNHLESAQAGIICLTPENRGSAWLHFERGAIATHGLTRQDGNANSASSSNKLFSFLFTMDTPQIEGPLSLFQLTTYLRDYNRDWVELARLTKAVLERFEGCKDVLESFGRCETELERVKGGAGRDEVCELLSGLLGKLRELQFVGFRDLLPGLEGHARQVIRSLDGLGLRSGRVQALSAMLGLRRFLEDREREMEVSCAPSQLMFFKRLVEVLSASSIGLERAIAEGTFPAVDELLGKLRRILEVAVEPLVPVLDDSWRYAFYGVLDRQEAYRKQKLLLIHPLETMLQRAELEEQSPKVTAEEQSPDRTWVPAGHLLSPKEKRRALRSYWAYDRVAAYIHYCEDVSRPKKDELKLTLFELT
jgi:hypothetical protein